jgi:hypothetical protein
MTRPVPERRLVLRLMEFWEARRQGRRFPALADIDPGAIADLWPSCFVLDTARHPSFPYFHYFGPALAQYSGVFLSGKSDWTATLLDKAVAKYREALLRQEPVLIEDELTRFDGRRLLFRSVLLPLSDDQRSVNFLLGAANGKLAAEKDGMRS